METMIHCASCQARLSVPKTAAGKTVRCPKCSKPVKVPKDDAEIVEDTVACWLEISAEEEQARKQAAASMPDPLDELPEYSPPEDLPGLDSSGGGEITTTVQAPAAPAKTKTQSAVAKAPATQAKPSPAPVAAPVSKSKPAAPMPGLAPATSGVAKQDALMTIGDEPRLCILETHATGVLVGFHDKLLNRPAFRASLPMSCAACGERDPELLVARPLIWSDRLTDHNVGTAYVAGKYELPVHGHTGPREVVAAMRPIDEMSPPYNNPIPYYTCKRCGPRAALHAHTVTEGDHVLCETSIPTAAYALEWLGRVNGICGDDYLTLEEFCGQNQAVDEAMADLPEQVRKRVGAWYTPTDGEHFVLYLKDGDYPKADAGLGGLVLTDHRLVYCKYHKHGVVLLNDPGTQLLAVRHGTFDDLISVTDGMKSKILRLRPDDTEQLGATLEGMECRVKLEREET